MYILDLDSKPSPNVKQRYIISEVCFLDLEERFQNGPSTTMVHL